MTISNAKRLLFAAVAGASIAGYSSAALAQLDPGCPIGGCEFDPDGGTFGDGVYDFDYTVPPTGQKYKWTISFTSTDPTATLTLTHPNQTEVWYDARGNGGPPVYFDENPHYTFDEFVKPGSTTIYVRAPMAYDFCASPGPIGEICSRTVQIWGNGTRLFVSSGAPVFATFAETAVPEPTTWLLLVAGFGLVGSTLRRHRTSLAA